MCRGHVALRSATQIPVGQKKKSVTLFTYLYLHKPDAQLGENLQNFSSIQHEDHIHQALRNSSSKHAVGWWDAYGMMWFSPIQNMLEVRKREREREIYNKIDWLEARRRLQFKSVQYSYVLRSSVKLAKTLKKQCKLSLLSQAFTSTQTLRGARIFVSCSGSRVIAVLIMHEIKTCCRRILLHFISHTYIQ